MKDPGKLLRLFRTLNLLAGSRRGYTVDELAEKLGVSRRTVYRDLIIYGQCGFEVLSHPITHRLRVSNPGETAEKIGFDVDEAHLLEEALLGLPEGPVRSDLLDKVRSFSGSSHTLGHYLTQQAGLHYRALSQAIRERIQVVLIDYNAPSSHSISDRLVEPYGFSTSLDTLYAFEPASRRNKNYKIVRIGQVRLERMPWQFSHLHEAPKTDAFGLPMGDIHHEIHLQLGQLSSNLLREEHPAAALLLSPLSTPSPSGRIQELRLRVADYRGIGRFVLGLADDIDVVGPPDFMNYLRKRANSLIRERVV
jgi:predicted DNA-binding transcriptional regulator YafY